jgi:HEPN domain-containing protein
MTRNDLRRLARIRLKEAGILLREGCYDGAYYLAGYAAECALKACIAKATRRCEFPDLEKVRDSYTHKLLVLVKVAGLSAMLDAERSGDSAFEVNWTTAKDWSEDARYAEHGEKQARDLYRALTNKKPGVMRWIRQHW